MKKFIMLLLLTAVVVFLDDGSANAASDATPVVTHSEKNDTSPSLRSVKPIPPRAAGAIREIFLGRPEKAKNAEAMFSLRGLFPTDTVVQSLATGAPMPSTDKNFEGMHNIWNVYPPDTNGAAGLNHYVQIVNLGFQIWDKNGNSLYGPADINTLWSGFGGECESENNGDPIVLYDHLADRWMISQFALGPSHYGPYYQCIAISQTGDPTGAWYRYAFHFSDSLMNDYPKFGIWPDGYYMSANQFTNGFIPNGAGVVAFERDKMLNNQPAQMVYFNLASANYCFGNLLPSDLDGPAPPAGTPNYFSSFDDGSSNCSQSSDHLKIWEFHVDWATPANSTFGIGGQPNIFLNTAPFDLMPNGGYYRNVIPQPGVGSYYYLDALGDRLMYRLQYRNFGTYAGMVVNHTVDAGEVRAGIRWYELRNSGNGWSIYQQGTYAPADTEHRWMGSIAMDGQGDIALGYSVSSSTVYPSIRYAGRLKDDPLGTLPQAEASIIAGTGSQTGQPGRWGDYSMMYVDPTDGCTFWYTTEYIQTTGASWQTRIASFQFPGCDMLEGTPASYDFGSVHIGGSSSSQMFTISNVGNADVIIASVTVTGTNNSDFAMTANDCSGRTLSPSQTCTVQVLFAPGAMGKKSAAINITYNSTTKLIPIKGTGVVTLAVNKSGTGTGTVTSSPPGIDCGIDCSEQYYLGTNVTLTAMPFADSLFTGWVGGCTGTGMCNITVNADTNITAAFDPCPNPPVMITGATPTYYSSLQAAYDAAANGDVIQAQGIDFAENLNVNGNKSVTLQGGYDCSYTNWVRDTYVHGAVTTSAGALTIGNFVLQ